MISQSIGVALRAVWEQKLRSILTMLGIIIGVGAVITLVTLGHGASSSVTKNIEGLGSNLLVVDVGTGVGESFGRLGGATTVSDTSLAPPPNLTLSEAQKLGNIARVVGVAPVVEGSGTLGVGTTTASVGLVGTTPAYQNIMNYKLQEGRFLTPLDETDGENVIVLRSTEAQTLFGAINPVGDTVTVNGVPFEVVGVLANKGTSLGQSEDSFAAIPIDRAESLLGSTSLSTVYLSAKSQSNVTAVISRLDQKLLSWIGTSQNFSVTAQSQILSTLTSVQNSLTLLLAGVAGISLIVGGIGIMNIMLVSVSERTREIGIRKAVGASRGAILGQFLIEALVLSGIGGLLGVGSGAAASVLLSKSFGYQPSFHTGIALLAFAFALAVGLVFGLWPANRAAGLRPVDALRVE